MIISRRFHSLSLFLVIIRRIAYIMSTHWRGHGATFKFNGPKIVMNDEGNRSEMMHFCKGSGTPMQTRHICRVSQWLQGPVVLQGGTLKGGLSEEMQRSWIYLGMLYLLLLNPLSLSCFLLQRLWTCRRDGAGRIGNPHLHVTLKNKGFCLFVTEQPTLPEMWEQYDLS